MRSGACLEGRRVLVAEDEFLLALELETLLRRQGCVVLGPVPTTRSALAVLERETPDSAVLDVNLRGQRATPIAAALRARDILFVLVTGYNQRQVSGPEMCGAFHLHKPVNGGALLRTLERLLNGA